MGVSSFLPPVQVLKSVQRGVASLGSANTPLTVTISAVNTAKAFLLVDLSTDDNSGAQSARGQLTDGTTVTLESPTASAKIAWQVVEAAS